MDYIARKFNTNELQILAIILLKNVETSDMKEKSLSLTNLARLTPCPITSMHSQLKTLTKRGLIEKFHPETQITSKNKRQARYNLTPEGEILSTQIEFDLERINKLFLKVTQIKQQRETILTSNRISRWVTENKIESLEDFQEALFSSTIKTQRRI
jgi:DNA-binding MarR family transcriptional regulator